MSLIKATVTFNGLSKFEGRPNPGMIHEFYANPRHKALAIEIFKKHELYMTSESDLTLSIEGKKEGYEKLFGTKLTRRRMPQSIRASEKSFLYPKDGADWNYEHELHEIIDDAYIQWPWYYLGKRFDYKDHSLYPPRVQYHHLRVPGDLAATLNASKVHRAGITGKGVRVVMLDSGFNFNHHHFKEHGYDVDAVLGPGALNRQTDPEGHGTAMAAALLAVAPGTKLTGIKLVNDRNDKYNTRLTEAFEEAMKYAPKVISISLAANLAEGRNQEGISAPYKELPKSLFALEALILDAVRKGVTVVCAAGNGDVAFPAMMRDVISVGGANVDEEGRIEASDYTSAYTSVIYSGRHVPDVCGLSGMNAVPQEGNANVSGVHGSYIMLPVQRLEQIDRQWMDRTHSDDSWAVAGGSSTAAAQVAGVCALLLEKDPTLKPTEIKALLKLSALDITSGTTNPDSNSGVALQAANGSDKATGAGLVDAFRAYRKV